MKKIITKAILFTMLIINVSCNSDPSGKISFFLIGVPLIIAVIVIGGIINNLFSSKKNNYHEYN